MMDPEILRIHRAAMTFYDAADRARKRHRPLAAQRRYARAATLETRAADMLAAISDRPALDLTRSILHKSAAWMAIRAGDLDTAARLVYQGLAVRPHPAIAGELNQAGDEVAKLKAMRESVGATELAAEY